MFKFLLMSCLFCISLSALADENFRVLKETCQKHLKEKHDFPDVPPPQNGTGYVEFEDGPIKITGYYKDGKRDGEWFFYWDGVAEFRGEYKPEENYESMEWLTYGYVYDDGPCEEYDENENLVAKYAYKDNQIDGIYEEYYPNGQLKYKKTYEKGELNGLYEEYFENGQLKVKTKKVEQIWRWPQNDGPYEEYFENGRLKEKSTYQLDDNPQNGSDKVGPYEIYNEKGQLMEKRDENDDYEHYYPDGTLQFKGHRNMGDEVYEEYYPNGQLKEKKDKNYSEKYTENGHITEKCNWYNSLQASCTFYKEDGTTTSGVMQVIY